MDQQSKNAHPHQQRSGAAPSSAFVPPGIALPNSLHSHMLLNALAVGVLVYDVQGVVRACNQAAQDLLGLTGEQLLGRHTLLCSEYSTHLDGTPMQPEQCPALIAQQTGQSCLDVPLAFRSRHGGAPVQLLCSAIPLLAGPDQAGQVAAVVCTFGALVVPMCHPHAAPICQSEHQQAAAYLRACEQRYRCFLDSYPEAVLIQSNGTIVYANLAGARLLGAVEPASLYNAELLRFVHPASHEALRPYLHALHQVGPYVPASEYTLLRLDQHPVVVEIVSAPLVFGGQHASQLLVRDVSGRKQVEAALHQAYAQTHSLLENISEAFYALDHAWRFMYINSEARRLLNAPPGNLIGQVIWEALPDLAGTHLSTALHTVHTNQIAQRFETHVPEHDQWLDVHIRPAPQGLIVLMRDSTERRRMQAHTTFQAGLLANVLDAVVVIDLEGRVLYWNEGAELLYGYTHAEALQQPFRNMVVYEEANGESEAHVLRILQEQGSWRSKFTISVRNGRRLVVDSSMSMLYDDQHHMLGILSVNRDITDQERSRERLWQVAHYDKLTSLPNRTLMLDYVSEALEAAIEEPGTMCALLFLDIDQFQVVNDSLGHMVGDRLLIEVAHRLCAYLPEEVRVARFGGDDFLVLLPGVRHARAARAMAEDIHVLLEQPMMLNQYEVVINMRIGIALSNEHTESAEDLLRAANTATNHAKRHLGLRTLLFDSAMYDHAVERLWVETALRQALEQNDIHVYYQPIVSLLDERIVGFEALVRWPHPERGLIGPQDFIGVAEETGLIDQIGLLVLSTACHQTQAWLDEGIIDESFTMHVNVSGREFFNVGMVQRVAQLLHRYDLPHAMLKLEITESVAMDRAEAAVHTIRQLRALGVRITLDDFGTGYSSLQYLARFPIHALKIDRSFVRTLHQRPESESIVHTILMLARALDLQVVAEGVESDVHIARLRELGCQLGQGFWFSEAVDASTASALLLTNPPRRNVA